MQKKELSNYCLTHLIPCALLAHKSGVVGGGAPCHVPCGRSLFLDAETKEVGRGFPTMVKWISDDKQFSRKIELKIEFFSKKTDKFRKVLGLNGLMGYPKSFKLP